jgi:hypothetical protein
MTAVHPPRAAPSTDAALVEVPTGEVVIGDRLRRLEQRRKLVREQILAVVVLLVALAATVGVLAMYWLGSGPAATALPVIAGAAAPASHFVDPSPGGFTLTQSAGVL